MSTRNSDHFILQHKDAENGSFNFSVIKITGHEYDRLIQSLSVDERHLFSSGETVLTDEYGKIRRLLKATDNDISVAIADIYVKKSFFGKDEVNA